MALSQDDLDLVQRQETNLGLCSADDVRHDAYYEGSHRLEQIGLAVPPELRRIETMVDWGRQTVDAVKDRLKMRRFYLPGEDTASAELRELWDHNNLDSESLVHHQETMILGRGFVSVGTNEDNPEFPLIRVESPREIIADIDQRRRSMRSAVRLYGNDGAEARVKYATIYRPDYTLWLERDGSRWKEVDRDDHRLGRVPLVMFLNRRRLGKWSGVSELKGVIPYIDGGARTLTNMSLGMETHAVPARYALGVTKGDFVGADGQPLPAWQAYFTSIWANANKDAKVGQFSASDMKNFHETIDKYAQLAASATGLPLRYFGIVSTNPASEGAIRAEEAGLLLKAEGKQAEFGDCWGWVMALAMRLRTGSWVQGSRIKTEWYDAATPTRAQTADAMSKLYANGQGILSREGVWDELGWSEARKDREREYLAREARMALTALEKDVSEAL